jgi:hypothetical protein
MHVKLGQPDPRIPAISDLSELLFHAYITLKSILFQFIMIALVTLPVFGGKILELQLL